MYSSVSAIIKNEYTYIVNAAFLFFPVSKRAWSLKRTLTSLLPMAAQISLILHGWVILVVGAFFLRGVSSTLCFMVFETLFVSFLLFFGSIISLLGRLEIITWSWLAMIHIHVKWLRGLLLLILLKEGCVKPEIRYWNLGRWHCLSLRLRYELAILVKYHRIMLNWLL